MYWVASSLLLTFLTISWTQPGIEDQISDDGQVKWYSRDKEYKLEKLKKLAEQAIGKTSLQADI